MTVIAGDGQQLKHDALGKECSGYLTSFVQDSKVGAARKDLKGRVRRRASVEELHCLPRAPEIVRSPDCETSSSDAGCQPAEVERAFDKDHRAMASSRWRLRQAGAPRICPTDASIQGRVHDAPPLGRETSSVENQTAVAQPCEHRFIGVLRETRFEGARP